MSEPEHDQRDVTPDPDAEPSADVTPGATPDPPVEDAPTADPGARPVDEDAPAVTQHVGQDDSVERAGADEDGYEEARSRAEATGATSFSVTTRREGQDGATPGAR